MGNSLINSINFSSVLSTDSSISVTLKSKMMRKKVSSGKALHIITAVSSQITHQGPHLRTTAERCKGYKGIFPSHAPHGMQVLMIPAPQTPQHNPRSGTRALAPHCFYICSNQAPRPTVLVSSSSTSFLFEKRKATP